MSNSTNTLTSELEQLKKNNQLLLEKMNVYEAKYEQARLAYDNLLQAFKQMQRRQFGQRSERFLDKNPAQADMFSNVDPQFMGDQAQEKEENKTVSTRTKSRKKKKSGLFDKGIPRREIIIPVENKSPDDKVIRYETTELLNYVPPILELIIQKREVVVSTIQASTIRQLITAPNPKRLLPKAGVTSEFLAYMIVSKLYDRQPLYHIEKMLSERFDLTCPRNKLARWFIESSNPLQPLVNLLQDTILDYDIASCDPTHLQVLNEPGRCATQKSYLYTIRGGPPDKLVMMYQYNADEHKVFLQHWFEGYQGYLQVDGQNIFDVFESVPGITLLYCNSHARRKFEPIAKAAQQPGLAYEAMCFYKALYKIERHAKKEVMTSLQRYHLRLEKTKPLIETFEAWIEEKGPLTLPKSPLGNAFTYVAKRTEGLHGFLNDGRLEIDTNLTEQGNKNFALARNNFMFACSVEGAKALANHMTLIFTALAHQLDPYKYYVHIMQHIPHCQTLDDYDALLPWNAHLKSTIEQEKVA